MSFNVYTDISFGIDRFIFLIGLEVRLNPTSMEIIP